MIKKYKKIGTLLLGLSCLTGGFFTPVENNSLIPTVQAAENRDKIVCNITTKELFNVVYGYLREKAPAYPVTFTMVPQSADDYGLIIVRCRFQSSSLTHTTSGNTFRPAYDHDSFVSGRRFFNFYIDKGPSNDISILTIQAYYGDYNFDFNKGINQPDTINGEVYSYHNMEQLAKRLNDYDNEGGNCDKIIQGYYNDISERVKKESSSAPSRSKER